MRRSLPALTAAVALTLASGGWSPAPAQAPSPAPAPVPAVSGPAPAVTADGAQALKTALSAGMKRWLADQPEGPAFQWQGEPVVMPSGDRYEVALPALTSVEADGTRLEVGVVRLLVRPLADARFGFEATLPSTMTILEKGAPTGSIAIGRQRIEGVWIPAFDTVLSFDVALGDVALTGADERLSLGSLTMMQDLQPDGASTWSGPAAMALSDLALFTSPTDDEEEEGDGDEDEDVDVDEKPTLRVGGLTVQTSVTRIDLAAADRLSRLVRTAQGGTPPVAGLIDSLRTMMGGASFRLRLNDLALADPESEQTVMLERMSVGGGVEGLDAERGTATLTLDAQGMRLDPPAAPAAFTPDRIDIALTLANVPSQALWQSLTDSTGDKRAGKGAGKGADDTAVQLMRTLSQAGTELRIDRWAMGTPALGARTSGAARFTENALFGATADLTVELRGLDETAKALQPKSGRQPDEETQEALGMIAMLQAMGQKAKDASGADVRTYHIQVTGEGAVLLNGADMGALLGMAPAPQDNPRAKRKE